MIEGFIMAEQFLTLMADLDDESQKLMSGWYAELQKYGFNGTQTQGLPIHISLAAYSLDKEAEVISLVHGLGDNFSKIPVYISHIGVFPGGNVLFGAPDMSPELLELHSASLKLESLQKFIWTPHATMIIDEPETIANALPIWAKSFVPFFGKIVRLHLCAFWPTREILTIELGDSL